RPAVVRQFPARQAPPVAAVTARTRVLATAADLTVAAVLAFGCAAGGSRLLWPVLLIACYYAAGVLFTGTSPMVALLNDGLAPAKPRPQPVAAPVPAPEPIEASESVPQRPAPRPARSAAADRPVRQRRGMQAPV
ncbi:MAG: hypothetical protein ABIX28_05335, partial [Vicinamibacterales bacterium]